MLRQFYFIFLIFLLAVSPRLPSRSSPNLPGGWQMGSNRKLELFNQIKSKRGICSAQHTQEQRPVAHYNNKIQKKIKPRVI